MSTLLIDYSFTHPAPSIIKAAGYGGVIRYIGTGGEKCLTRSEVATLAAAGLGIALVYESTANRAAQGYAAGKQDATAALAAANYLGVPTEYPIFLAVDFDAHPADVSAYFAGARSVLGGRTGIYGSLAVTSANLAPWRWQTCAWSDGKVDPTAHLYQRLRPTVKVPIKGTDEDVVLKAGFPLWFPGGQPKPATPAVKTPAVPTKPVTVTHGNVDNARTALIAAEKANRGAGPVHRRVFAAAAAALRALRGIS